MTSFFPTMPVIPAATNSTAAVIRPAAHAGALGGGLELFLRQQNLVTYQTRRLGGKLCQQLRDRRFVGRFLCDAHLDHL